MPPRRERTRDRTGAARGEGTRDALLAAALRVVERDGVAAATTRAVAAEAGLPLGAVHYWFADKRQLLASVVDALLQQVRAEAAGPSPSVVDDAASGRDDADGHPEGDGLERLAGVHRRLAALPAGRQVALVEVTTLALRDPDLTALARQQYAGYRATALHALGALADRADAQLPGGSAALATLVVAVLDGLTLSSLADGDDRGASADDAVALLLHLLRGALDGASPRVAAGAGQP